MTTHFASASRKDFNWAIASTDRPPPRSMASALWSVKPSCGRMKLPPISSRHFGCHRTPLLRPPSSRLRPPELQNELLRSTPNRLIEHAGGVRICHVGNARALLFELGAGRLDFPRNRGGLDAMQCVGDIGWRSLSRRVVLRDVDPPPSISAASTARLNGPRSTACASPPWRAPRRILTC
jgi:hypothetical protein